MQANKNQIANVGNEHFVFFTEIIRFLALTYTTMLLIFVLEIKLEEDTLI